MPSDTEAWAVLGGHAIFEEIARGGMGVIYRGRQIGLNRDVAVKVLRGGEFADPTARRRFQTEAKAAARLQHPGIVAIHDVGEENGLPWFSMDLLPGGNLSQRVGDTPLGAREAAACVREVALAVQHAHAQGVLHRDLKPSNIVLTAGGSPRVTDFGIACFASLEGADPLTRTGQALGSPGYAAPELALGGRADARTDVYGLAALLYFLLTARPPFQGPTSEAILLQLRENDPVPPRHLNPSVPRDLETICLHGLSKDPTKRYATAQEVADELARFLANEPIRARPTGHVGHILRWCRRRPGLAAMAGLAVLLAAGLAASGFLYGARQAQFERRAELLATAREQRSAARNSSRSLALRALREAWQIKPSAEIRNEAVACLALPEIVLAETVPRAAPPERTRAGEPFAAKLSGTTVQVTDAATGALRHTLVHPRRVFCLDWRDNLLVTMCEDRFLYVWDLATGRLSYRLSGHEGLPAAVAFREGGQEFVSLAQDAQARLWHAGRGREEAHFVGSLPHQGMAWWQENDRRLFARRLDGTGVDVFAVTWPRSVKILAPPSAELHTENSGSVALNSEGSLAATVDESAVRVWNLKSARLEASIAKSPTEWMSVRFAPDSSALWVSGFDAQLLRLPLDGATVGPPQKFLAQSGALLVDISRNGDTLALSHNGDHRWLLVTTGGELRSLPDTYLMAASFSPDGSRLATTSYQRPGVKIWSLANGRIEQEIPTDSPAAAVRFTPDGTELVVLTERHLVRLATGDWRQVSTLAAGHLRGLNFSADLTLAAACDRAGVRLLDPRTLREIVRLTPPPSTGSLELASLSFSRDGNVLAAHTAEGALVVWDLPGLRSELRELGMDW
jgi:WD40 repeat protein